MARAYPPPPWGTYEDNSRGKVEQIDLEKYSKPVEDLQSEVTSAMEKEYKEAFDRNIEYKGNEVYSILGLYGTNQKQLFLMYCLLREDLKMADFASKMTALRNKKGQSSAGMSDEDLERSFHEALRQYKTNDKLNNIF